MRRLTSVSYTHLNYDFIIIDCPPSLSLLTINALTASDTVLVPIQCEYYALEGLTQILQTIDLVKKKLNPKLELEGVVFTMYDARTNLSLQVVENVKKHLNRTIYKTIIPRNVRLAEAPSHGTVSYTHLDVYKRQHYGMIKDGEEILDEVLVIAMRGPHSYTAEDTVEIDCHGGVLVMKKILETVIKYGARPAEPGEFTKRAFLNGRIDLSQAEAVMDVIHSKNDYAMKSSVSQLKGSLSRKIRKLREDILYQIAFIESALDDPEHISLEGYEDELMEKLNPMIDQMESMVCLLYTSGPFISMLITLGKSG